MVTPVLLVALLAGCGGGGGAKPNGEAAKGAQQILTDMEAALGKVKSFHLTGTVHDQDGLTNVSGDVALPRHLDLTLHNGAKQIEVIIIASDIYMKANSAFWKSVSAGGPPLEKLLSDKWVKAGGKQAPDLGKFASILDPATIGHCFVGPRIGTLTKVGTDKVGGKPVIVLEDKGDKPGTQPGRVYISTEGSPLPVRAVQTGPTTPGGTPDASCGEKTVNTSSGTGELLFTNYDKSVSIQAPAGALDFSNIPGAGG